MNQQELKEKFSYEIRESWSTDNDGNSYHVKDIIAYDNNQVEKWLKENYNLENSNSDLSDDTNIMYEYSGLYNCDNSELIEKSENCELCDNGESENCDKHFWRSDQISANKSEKPLSKNELEYLLSGKHYCSVIDLTQEII